MPLEKTALGNIPSLAASQKRRVGSLDCRKIRTVSISCRVTYGVATSAVRINLYYSADGEHYDTVPFAYFDVDRTNSITCQETHIFDFPEHGYMDIEVYNQDSSVAATNALIFVTVVRWKNKE